MILKYCRDLYKTITMKQQIDYSNELDGKIALVTGGTKGAGKAIAHRLRLAGAKVIVTARNKPVDGDNDLHFIQADFSVPETVDNIVSLVIEKFERLDILVNNLGGSETPGGGFEKLSDDDWLSTIRTNLLTPINLDRGFLPQMIKRGTGVIIHIASIQGKLPFMILLYLMPRQKPALLITAKACQKRLPQRVLGW